MKDFWLVFKEGAIEAVGRFGALFIILVLIVYSLVLILGLQVVLILGWIFRHKLSTYNAITELNLNVEDLLVNVTDSYLVWYEKITTAIKNLVK